MHGNEWSFLWNIITLALRHSHRSLFHSTEEKASNVNGQEQPTCMHRPKPLCGSLARGGGQFSSSSLVAIFAYLSCHSNALLNARYWTDYTRSVGLCTSVSLHTYVLDMYSYDVNSSLRTLQYFGFEVRNGIPRVSERRLHLFPASYTYSAKIWPTFLIGDRRSFSSRRFRFGQFIVGMSGTDGTDKRHFFLREGDSIVLSTPSAEFKLPVIECTSFFRPAANTKKGKERRFVRSAFDIKAGTRIMAKRERLCFLAGCQPTHRRTHKVEYSKLY